MSVAVKALARQGSVSKWITVSQWKFRTKPRKEVIFVAWGTVARHGQIIQSLPDGGKGMVMFFVFCTFGIPWRYSVEEFSRKARTCIPFQECVSHHFSHTISKTRRYSFSSISPLRLYILVGTLFWSIRLRFSNWRSVVRVPLPTWENILLFILAIGAPVYQHFNHAYFAAVVLFLLSKSVWRSGRILEQNECGAWREGGASIDDWRTRGGGHSLQCLW